jgi:fluoroacetyl-CoA thioesterase
MKASLRPGASRANRIVVDHERTISFMGEEGRVYATPWIVHDVEHACRDLLLEHADPGEDSVGIDVAIKHAAPTPPGMTVEITVTVTAVEGRKVEFDFTAKDEIEPIGRGTHARFVVDVVKTLERVKAKAAKQRAR